MDPAAPARHAALRHARRNGTTRSNQKQELSTTGQTPKAHGIEAGAVASPEIADNTKIGEGAITRLPNLPKGSPIDVTFNMSATGVLSVDAIELTTKKRLKFDLQIKGLSGQKLEAARDTVSHYDISE